MRDTAEEIYVRPKDGDFEVLKAGHRRGLTFDSQDLAIEHAREIAPLVLVLNRTGKVEREVHARDDLRALAVEYYAALAPDDREEGDGAWAIVERWFRGEHVGWFVEHGGHRYEGFEGRCGEDGPYSTREAAASCMAMHLRRAIVQAGTRR
jgi:hypothetical protein